MPRAMSAILLGLTLNGAYAQDPEPAGEPAAEEPADRTRPDAEPEEAPAPLPVVQTRPPPAPTADLPSEIPEYRHWLADSPAAQLAADTTAVPPGSGALFVPAMLGDGEPAYFVHRDGARVAEGSGGKRVALPPGSYTLVGDSGEGGREVAAPFAIAAGELTYVEPPWGLLRVHLIDVTGAWADVRYDVFDVGHGELLGGGRSLDTEVGTPEVWVVDPGIYKIVRRGGSIAAHRDFSTALVPPASVVPYVVVVDESTGQFRGGGVVSNELPEGRATGGLDVGLSVGGDLSLNQRSGAVATTDGMSYEMTVFGAFGAVFDQDPHLVQLASQAELGLTARPFLPIARTNDRVSAEAMYTLRIENPYAGPYLRGAARTSVFTGYQYFDDETDVHIYDSAGDLQRIETVVAADKLRFPLSGALSPLILQESAGLNVQAVDLEALHANARVGYALRHGFTGGVTSPSGVGTLIVRAPMLDPGEDLDGLDAMAFQEVDPYMVHGPEAGAHASFKFLRVLYAQGDAMFLLPVTAPSDFIVESQAAAGLDLFGVASLSYAIRADLDPFLVEGFQLDQSVFARAHWNLL